MSKKMNIDQKYQKGDDADFNVTIEAPLKNTISNIKT